MPARRAATGPGYWRPTGTTWPPTFRRPSPPAIGRRDRPRSPPGLLPAVSRRANAAGTLVAGRYKLLQKVGEGGMGAVWAAEQTQPVRRKVAIKLVKPGMDSRAVLARFEAERQALALMDHPHIAKVLDAGATPDGRPFFVMELVDGVPLTDYCDARRLPISGRLELFRQVCGAVQHAHQKGVIHRDIKPSNVLVEEHDGVPVAQGHRLRAGQGRRRRPADRPDPVHRPRFGGRHPAVHGPRAGRPGRPGRGHAGRRLRPRGRPVRAADRQPADQPRGRAAGGPPRGAAGDPRGRAAAAEQPAGIVGRPADGGRQPRDGAGPARPVRPRRPRLGGA